MKWRIGEGEECIGRFVGALLDVGALLVGAGLIGAVCVLVIGCSLALL